MKEEKLEWKEKRLVFGRLVAVTKSRQIGMIDAPAGKPSVEIEVKEWSDEFQEDRWETYYYEVDHSVDLDKLASKLGKDVELTVVDGKVVSHF